MVAQEDISCRRQRSVLDVTDAKARGADSSQSGYCTGPVGKREQLKDVPQG